MWLKVLVLKVYMKLMQQEHNPANSKASQIQSLENHSLPTLVVHGNNPESFDTTALYESLLLDIGC